MPVFRPSILIADAYGSVGDVTFYHRNGKCYYRKRTSGNYKGTAAQTAALDVHQRALAAWRTLTSDVQKTWNRYGRTAEPHKPPFDHSSWISGHNLFVSAYHGFFTLGNEHVPEPQSFLSFPPCSLEFSQASVEGNMLKLAFRYLVTGTDDPGRYRFLIRLQLTKPGAGRNPSKMRNVLALETCTGEEGEAEFVLEDYVRFADGLLAENYQAHCEYRLLDTVTGYRNNASILSFPVSLQK